MVFCTVFTPTYNRAYTLRALYDSLCRQTEQDFEWLIIDDGSTDNTEELIKNFQAENKITIRYFKQENSGKHVAHNKALEEASGELFLVVDSDDYLTDDAIETFWNYSKKLSNKSSIAGIVGLCIDQNNKLIGTEFPEDELEMNYLDMYYKRGVQGDKCIAWFTQICKNFPFPVIQGEKYMTPGIVHGRISNQQNLFCINKILKQVEYRIDGISRNGWKLAINNPKGLYLWNKEISTFLKDMSILFAVKTYARIVRFGLLANIHPIKQFTEARSKIYYLLGFLPGLLLFIRDKVIYSVGGDKSY